MTPETRRAVAFVAGRTLGKRTGSALYDFSVGGYIYFSGSVADQVTIYDHTSSSHITGSKENLYHFAQSANLSIQYNGKNFSGFDFGTSSHFNGSVSGGNVTLYDFSNGTHFHYLVS